MEPNKTTAKGESHFQTTPFTRIYYFFVPLLKGGTDDVASGKLLFDHFFREINESTHPSPPPPQEKKIGNPEQLYILHN
jgi:hypothetical protein